MDLTAARNFSHAARTAGVRRIIPKGLLGLIYWYVFYRIHKLVFSGLIREMARQAETPYRDNER
jgi:hypothetical protein